MKLSKLLFYMLTGFTFVSSVFASDSVLSLNDCLKIGMENNPHLKSASLMVDSAQEDINAAKADFLPSVSSSINYGIIKHDDGSGKIDTDYIDQQNTVYSVGVSQVLYAGNRLVNTRDRAVERRKMFLEDRAYTEAELAYQIKSTYFQLMKAKQDVQIGIDTVKRLEADATAVRAFYDKEMAAYAQVLQAEVDLADARQQLSRIKNTVDRKKSDLFVMMNQPFNPDTTFSGGLDYYPKGFRMTQSECLEKAIATRPDLKSLDHQIVMAKKDVAIAEGQYYPIVKLNAGYYNQDKNYKDQQYQGTSALTGEAVYSDLDYKNQYWSAGVNLSWNLFDGGRAWYQRSRSKIDILRLKEQTKGIVSRLESGIVTSLLSLSEAEERIKATAEGIISSKEYYEMEDKRFQAGIATISSVLDAQVRVTRAHGNYNQALLDYQLARADLDFLIGSAVE